MTDTLLTDIANGYNKLFDENESLRQQLAECQAREKVLRDAAAEAIEDEDQVNYERDIDCDHEAWCIDHKKCKMLIGKGIVFKVLNPALAMPSDSTALDTLKKQWQREALLEAASRLNHEPSIQTWLGNIAKEIE